MFSAYRVPTALYLANACVGSEVRAKIADANTIQVEFQVPGAPTISLDIPVTGVGSPLSYQLTRYVQRIARKLGSEKELFVKGLLDRFSQSAAPATILRLARVYNVPPTDFGGIVDPIRGTVRITGLYTQLHFKRADGFESLKRTFPQLQSEEFARIVGEFDLTSPQLEELTLAAVRERGEGDRFRRNAGRARPSDQSADS